jgi:hypothetical protein
LLLLSFSLLKGRQVQDKIAILIQIANKKTVATIATVFAYTSMMIGSIIGRRFVFS